MKYENWTRIPWDGNKDLGYECWRKSFGSRHVSVGIGEFDLVVHSFGASSDKSYSGTRWRKNGSITEEEAMEIIDKKY